MIRSQTVALKTTLSLTLTAVAVSLFYSQSVHAWGHAGHQIIAEVGSSLSKAFFKNNETTMGKLANVPDRVWKSLPTKSHEKQTHFYEPDAFMTDPSKFVDLPRIFDDAIKAFTDKKVIEHGTAPWRINQMFEAALASAATGDYVAVLQMAGTMSHYVGDLAQPLHVTENYDGQKTGNRGIHKYFETDNLEAVDFADLKNQVKAATLDLLAKPAFANAYKSGSVTDWAFTEILRSYAFMNEVNETDVKMGRTGEGALTQLNLAIARMAEGTAVLTILLDRMAKEIGNLPDGTKMMVPVPAWLKPFYVNMDVPAMLSAVRQHDEAYHDLHLDDCYQ